MTADSLPRPSPTLAPSFAFRVKAGLKRARAEGKVFGRPRVGSDVEAKVLALRKQGRGIRGIAKELEMGVCTVYRIIGEAA